jgi:hypothetical protein
MVVMYGYGCGLGGGQRVAEIGGEERAVRTSDDASAVPQRFTECDYLFTFSAIAVNCSNAV